MEIAVFAGVSERVLQKLGSVSVTEIVPDGTVVVSEGACPQYLHIVRKGVIELYAQSGGNRSTLCLLGSGDCFILAAVVSSTVSLMSARTLGQTELIDIPAQTFRKFLKTDQRLLANVSMQLAGGYRSLVRQLRDQKLRTASQRLAAYLVRLHREQGAYGVVTLPLRKQLIASLLGMQPASLSRAFAELQFLGVTVDRDRVSVASLEVLEAVAGTQPQLDEPDA